MVKSMEFGTARDKFPRPNFALSCLRQDLTRLWFCRETQPTMSVSDRIRRKIEAALKPERLAVYNDSHLHAGHHPGAQRGEETHFRLEVVAASFAGQSRIER